jgi:hypothetical protein
MSVQERAQQSLSQLDKEVSTTCDTLLLRSGPLRFSNIVGVVLCILMS